MDVDISDFVNARYTTPRDVCGVDRVEWTPFTIHHDVDTTRDWNGQIRCQYSAQRPIWGMRVLSFNIDATEDKSVYYLDVEQFPHRDHTTNVDDAAEALVVLMPHDRVNLKDAVQIFDKPVNPPQLTFHIWTVHDDELHKFLAFSQASGTGIRSVTIHGQILVQR